MGVGYPSKREADRLERWPQRIELEDLSWWESAKRHQRSRAYGWRLVTDSAPNRLSDVDVMSSTSRPVSVPLPRGRRARNAPRMPPSGKPGRRRLHRAREWVIGRRGACQ